MIPVPAKWLTAVFAVLTLAFAGEGRAAEPLRVVATFSILGDMVRQVGGDAVTVATLVGPGGDPHVYEPTPSDVGIVVGARVVIINGLGIEGWIERLIKASGTKAVVATASRDVAPLGLEERDGEGKPDPHAWQDLTNGRLYVRNIAEALAKADPARASDYHRRGQAYDEELKALDLWVRGEVGRVPDARRRIITSHDAFRYFAKAYGVTFLAPVGLGTESEPTASGLAGLVRQIRSEGVKTLFVETMADPRLMRTLERETGATIGGDVYSDSLSPPGGPADTYAGMFRHNVPAFVAAMTK